MSLFSGPEEHAANPPETWEVVKVTNRLWHLRPAGSEHPLQAFQTKTEAEQHKVRGFYVELWHKERRWYAGENFAQWKPYAQVVEENERREVWLRERANA